MDSDDKAMDNSSLGEQKTVLTLGRKPLPMPSSKNGNKIHTGLDHSGNCAMTNNLLSGVPFNAMLFDNGATCCCAKTDMGRLLGSYSANPDVGGISIGHICGSISMVADEENTNHDADARRGWEDEGGGVATQQSCGG